MNNQKKQIEPPIGKSTMRPLNSIDGLIYNNV